MSWGLPKEAVFRQGPGVELVVEDWEWVRQLRGAGAPRTGTDRDGSGSRGTLCSVIEYQAILVVSSTMRTWAKVGGLVRNCAEKWDEIQRWMGNGNEEASTGGRSRINEEAEQAFREGPRLPAAVHNWRARRGCPLQTARSTWEPDLWH